MTSEISDICTVLRDMELRVRRCIRWETRLNNSLRGVARWQLGWFDDERTEQERKTINRQAASLVSALRKGKPPPISLGDDPTPFMEHFEDTEMSLAPWTSRREHIEREMNALAKRLPVMPFVDEPDRRGFGVHGLAVIIGNAGDLSLYPTPDALVKRLGWAPSDTYKSGVKSEGRKVPRARKGRIYGVVAPQIIKAQVRVVKDADGKDTGERKTLGKYGEIYLRQKARLLERFTAEGGKAPKWHADKTAQRAMLQALIRDLWQAWREARHRMPEEANFPVPPADYSGDVPDVEIRRIVGEPDNTEAVDGPAW